MLNKAFTNKAFTAQIPSPQCLPCLNFSPIPYYFSIVFLHVDESQSQCMKSYFPSQKNAQIAVPILPLRDAHVCTRLLD